MNYGIFSRAVDQGAVLLQRGSQRPGGGSQTSQGWHSQPGRSSSGISLGSTGTVWMVPIILIEPSVLEILGFEVTTGAAGSARIGLYDSEPTGLPGPFQGDYGAVDTAVAAFKNVQIGQLLPAGVWWAAIFAVSGSPTYRTYEGAATDSLHYGANGQSSATAPPSGYQSTTSFNEFPGYMGSTRIGTAGIAPRASWKIS